MKAIDRLFQYFEYKGVKPGRFEKEVGLSNGYLAVTLKRKGDIGSKIVELITSSCRDLSQEWLMLGKGNMLITPDSEIKEVVSEIRVNGKLVSEIERENEFLRKEIELKDEIRKQDIELMEYLKTKANEDKELLKMLNDRIKQLEGEKK